MKRTNSIRTAYPVARAAAPATMLASNPAAQAAPAANQAAPAAAQVMATAFAAFAMALALLCALAATALAGEVSAWEAQTSITPAQATANSVDLDAVYFSGAAGDTVYLTVSDGTTTAAKYRPFTLGGQGESSDVFTVTAPLKDGKLASTYTVEVYSDRADKTPNQTFTVYGVYAALSGDGSSATGDTANDDATNTTQILIGSRTISAGNSPAFNAPETLHVQGQTYTLESSAPEDNNNVLIYKYTAAKPQQQEGAIDGAISYVDASGTVVATSVIANIPYNGEKTVAIPSAVTGPTGKVYRTMSFNRSVTAKNPGSATFTVSCVEISKQEQSAYGYYVAKIQMVDEKGNVIAEDSVNVNGNFKYTAPSTIYKTMEVDKNTRAVTYNLADSPQTLPLSAQDDKALVQDGERLITFHYQTASLDPVEVTVTFNQINGQQRAKATNKSRALGTQTAVVSPSDKTAKPAAQIKVDNTVYNLAGSVANYEYEYGSHQEPVVNVYYVPEGYTPDEAYEVTVNYVNFSTNQVVASETFESLPTATADVEFVAPETFTEDGTTYVRLDGQSEGISHNYFSHNTTYTVYYRNSADTLTAGTVINRVRVVYDQPAEGTASQTGNAASGSTATGNNGNNATGNNATADANNAADNTTAAGNNDATGATDNAQLNQNGAYNVMDGDANQTLTNNEGVDSNTERIDDEETPLASAEDIQAMNEQGAGAPGWALPVGVVAVLAAAAAAWFVVARRRNNDGRQA